MMKNLTIAIALLFGLLLGLVSDLPGALAAPATIKDAAQKKKLLGKHMLSLQWLLFDKPKYGTATVTERDGVLYLKGEQIAGGKDKDYLKKKTYGKVPKYMEKIKKEIEDEYQLVREMQIEEQNERD